MLGLGIVSEKASVKLFVSAIVRMSFVVYVTLRYCGGEIQCRYLWPRGSPTYRVSEKKKRLACNDLWHLKYNHLQNLQTFPVFVIVT